MTATLNPTPTTTPDAAGAARTLSFGRACAVEARKLGNTRAGATLVGVAAFLSGGFAGGMVLFGGPDLTFGRLATLASLPVGMIVTVMAILLVSTEFSARTAPVTFTLDPRRGRVLAAKATVVVGLAVVATLLAHLAAALVTLVAPAITGTAVAWDADGVRLVTLLATAVFQALAGAGLALVLRNAPAPIVVLLAWPTMALLVAALSPVAAAVLDHLDPQAPLQLLHQPGAVVPVVVSTLVWVVAPAALGTARLLRRDI